MARPVNKNGKTRDVKLTLDALAIERLDKLTSILGKNRSQSVASVLEFVCTQPELVARLQQDFAACKEEQLRTQAVTAARQMAAAEVRARRRQLQARAESHNLSGTLNGFAVQAPPDWAEAPQEAVYSQVFALWLVPRTKAAAQRLLRYGLQQVWLSLDAFVSGQEPLTEQERKQWLAAWQKKPAVRPESLVSQDPATAKAEQASQEA